MTGRIDKAMTALMSTQDGRALVWSQLTACGVFVSSFHTNELVTAFNEGQRNLGLQLLAHVNRVSGKDYSIMVLEAVEAKPTGT